MLTTDSDVQATTASAVHRPPGLTIVVPHRVAGEEPADELRALAAALGPQDRAVELVAIPYGPGATAPDLPAAIGVGMSGNRSSLVAWVDPDRSADPRVLPGFLRLLDLYDADAVVGSKQHPESDVGLQWWRRAGGRGYRSTLNFLFGTELGDPRIGVKLFRRSVLEDLLFRCRETGPAFEVELLVLAHRRGYRRIIEAPVQVDREAAPLRPRDVARLLRDTAALCWRLSR